MLNDQALISLLSLIHSRQTPEQAVTLDGLLRQRGDSMATDVGPAKLLGRGRRTTAAQRENVQHPITNLIIDQSRKNASRQPTFIPIPIHSF